MNKAKFTIGATAFVLAVAGAIATRANNKVKFLGAFTYNGASTITNCKNSGSNPCRNASLSTLYTAADKSTNSLVKTILTTH